MGSAFAKVESRESTSGELQPHVAGGNVGFLIVSLLQFRRVETQALAATAGDERRDTIQTKFAARHIGTAVDLTDLQGEGVLQELGEEPIQQRERRPDFVLPQKR